MDERKVTDTIKVEDLGAKTVLCRCWKSNKFPLCDGQCSMDYDADQWCCSDIVTNDEPSQVLMGVTIKSVETTWAQLF